MEKSAYKKDNKQKIKLNYEKQYKNIIIFSHCFFDSPHRFRYLIFNDFYEQINFFLEWLNNNSDYKIFIKQHPNDLPENKYIFDSLINQNKKSNIVFVDKEINNFQLLKLKPKFAITNYGTIAHEYAYLGIPVINTGDNPHINYNFNIHAKTKENLNHILCNIDFYIKKINFNKNNIYEYIFMHYVYSTNEFNEKKFLSEEFFFSKNSTINSNSNLFNYYLKNKNIHSKKIEKYINYFLRKNNLI